MATILCVDADGDLGPVLQQALEGTEHRIGTVATVPLALQSVAERTVELIVAPITDHGAGALELLDLLQREERDIPLLAVTCADPGQAARQSVHALRGGAADCVPRPLHREQLSLAVERALAALRLRQHNEELRRELVTLRAEQHIVGQSTAIQRVLEIVATAAPTRASVLLHGESGTGKALLARTIHDASERRDRPFVALRCAALPEDRVESSLFGHERGAFRGATRRVEGAVERASGGTLVLEEVSGLRLELQDKLLRVLEQQSLQRVGGTHQVSVDVRVIATTTRDLAALVAEGAFCADLLAQLSTVPVRMPALRERRSDIPLLAHRFATRAAQELGRPFEAIDVEALTMLNAYDWPGNVRELQQVVQRAVLACAEPVLQPWAFGGMGARLSPAAGTQARTSGATLADNGSGGNGAGRISGGLPHGAIVLTSLNIQEAEAALIEKALAATKGNRTRAAELLGMSVRTLRNKLNAPVS